MATCFLLPSPQRPETHPRSETPGQCHRVPTPWGCRPVPSVCCFPWASHHLATPASLALPSLSDPQGFSECTVGQAPTLPTFPEPLPRHSPGPKLGPRSHRLATPLLPLARNQLGSLGPGASHAGERLHFHFHALEREIATTPVFLPGESQGPGAWWSAVYGVTQSRTRLKRLSSSSSSSMLER